MDLEEWVLVLVDWLIDYSQLEPTALPASGFHHIQEIKPKLDWVGTVTLVEVQNNCAAFGTDVLAFQMQICFVGFWEAL
jgi:hypothetical protein